MKVEIVQKVGTVEKVCPLCDVPLLQDTKFCGSCGKQIEETGQTTREHTPEEKVCLQCGDRLSVTAVFFAGSGE
jgi:predicted amidophosphoribosyltransferase